MSEIGTKFKSKNMKGERKQKRIIIPPPCLPRRFTPLSVEKTIEKCVNLGNNPVSSLSNVDTFDFPRFLLHRTYCANRFDPDVFSLGCEYIAIICIDALKKVKRQSEARCLPHCCIGKIYKADALRFSGFQDVPWLQLMGDDMILMCLSRDELGKMFPGPCHVSGCVPSKWFEGAMDTDTRKYTIENVKRVSLNNHNFGTMMFWDALGRPVQAFNGKRLYAYEYFMKTCGLNSTPAQFSMLSVKEFIEKHRLTRYKMWREFVRSERVQKQEHLDLLGNKFIPFPFLDE